MSANCYKNNVGERVCDVVRVDSDGAAGSCVGHAKGLRTRGFVKGFRV